MKKLALIAMTATVFTLTSCNNEEKKTEEISIEEAAAQMTQALDTTNSVAPVVTDSAAAPAAH